MGGILKCSKECSIPFTALHTHTMTCRKTLGLIYMALVPHLLNTILKIGKGDHRILVSILYLSLRGLRLGQVEADLK